LSALIINHITLLATCTKKLARTGVIGVARIMQRAAEQFQADYSVDNYHKHHQQRDVE